MNRYIKRILQLLIQKIKLKRENQKLIDVNNMLDQKIFYNEVDINTLLHRNNCMRKDLNKMHQYLKNINHLITCPMCCKSAVFHNVFDVKGTCIICKEEREDIYSTTCGHICCQECATNVINHYNILEN